MNTNTKISNTQNVGHYQLNTVVRHAFEGIIILSQ